MRVFKKKEFLRKIDIRRKVGSYANLKKILEEKGLLIEVVETTSKGGGGTVWLISKDNNEYVAISTYSRQVISKRDGRKYYIYRYYLVGKNKLNELMQILQ